MTDATPQYSTGADELRHLEDNIATVAFHLGQPGARLSVSHDGPGLVVDPGEVLKEISRRLGIAQGQSGCGVRLEARPADDSEEWTEIFPAQLEWCAKQGHQVRAFDVAYASPIPRAIKADAESGWRLDFGWLDQLRGQIEKATGYQVTIECVQEAVLRTEALLLSSTNSGDAA